MPGFEPPQIGGLFTPSDGQAEPRLVAPAFARRAAELGARFIEGCGLTGIDVAGGKVIAARTECGEIRTGHIICAAGAASWRVRRSLGIALPQHQVRGTVARTSSGPSVGAVAAMGGGIDVLPDGIPVLDAPTTPSGLMVATGFCGHGFALGPIVGKTLADWFVTGQPPVHLHDLRLSRYAEGDVKPPHSLF